MKVSEAIREIMAENNLSQEQLAKLLSVSQKAVSNWINGVDKPNTSSLLAIYNNFGITPNEILEIKEDSFIGITSMQHYTQDEQQLVEAYRAMSPGKKKALFDMLDIDAVQQKKFNKID